MSSRNESHKIPPQNVEAESAILGSMLLEEEAIAVAIESINENAFYDPKHKILYEAILKLYEQGKPADSVTLTDELSKQGKLEVIGGPGFIISLTSNIPTAANIQHYLNIVKEKFVLRSLINSSMHISQQCYESSGNADNILDEAEQMIFDIASNKIESRAVSLKEIIKDSIETIDNLYQRKEQVTGLATGYHDFDIMTAGLQSSDLIILAARPSMGKSALVACVAEHIAVVENKPVAFFSLEMSKESLVQRLLCSHARVELHKVRTGFLAQSDWPKLTMAASKLSNAPFYIDDTPGISVLELRAKARRLKVKHDIQLIVLDYLQLMKGHGRAESRQQEITEISRSIKSLARELKVPIIALSQLSRAVEQRQDKRPQLSDLRESGAIEQDADLVLLLLREEYYNPTEDNKGEADLIVAKQRNGPTGTIKLAFRSEFTRFENFARRNEVDF